MRRKDSDEWGDGRKRRPRITSLDPDRYRSVSEEKESMAAQMVDGTAEPSNEVACVGDSSESEWKNEPADSRGTDVAVKEQLRVLTDDFKLRFMDVKDSVVLRQPPLATVPLARIKNLIKYQRAARARGGNPAKAEGGREEEKRPTVKKLSRKEAPQS